MKKKLLPIALLLLFGALIWNWSTPDSTPPQPARVQLKNSQPPAAAPITVTEPTPASRTEISDQQPQQDVAPIAAFRDWTKTYLAAPQSQRQMMLAKGAELATTHTLVIAGMIRTDPQQAIANAVPMVVRQDLPESIVRLLEKRVRMNAALEVYGNVPLPGAEVTIDCENMDTSDPTLCSVWFGSQRAPIVALSPRRVLAVVPSTSLDAGTTYTVSVSGLV